MSNKFVAVALLFLILLMSSFSFPQRTMAATVSTGAPVMGGDNVTFSGFLSDSGGSSTAFFQYGETDSYGFTTNQQTISGGSFYYIMTLPDLLSYETHYHYRAVCEYGGNTILGQDRSFTTGKEDSPVVITEAAVSKSRAVALHSTFSSGYGDKFFYFEWDNHLPNEGELYGNLTYMWDAGDSETSGTSTLYGLTPGTYYYRAVAVYGVNPSTVTYYGEPVSFVVSSPLTYHVTNIDELRAMADDPGGNYIIDNNISGDWFTNRDSEVFFGTIDGGNYALTLRFFPDVEGSSYMFKNWEGALEQWEGSSVSDIIFRDCVSSTEGSGTESAILGMNIGYNYQVGGIWDGRKIRPSFSNIRFENCQVSSRSSGGMMTALYIDASLDKIYTDKDCIVTHYGDNDAYLGMLSGKQSGNMNLSKGEFHGTIVVESSDWAEIGGIASYIYGAVVNCAVYVNITTPINLVNYRYYIGGITSRLNTEEDSIVNCLYKGLIVTSPVRSDNAFVCGITSDLDPNRAYDSECSCSWQGSAGALITASYWWEDCGAGDFFTADNKRVGNGLNTGLSVSATDIRNGTVYEGWDFSNVWGLDPDINEGNPYLLWTNDLSSSFTIFTEGVSDLKDDEASLNGYLSSSSGNVYFQYGKTVMYDSKTDLQDVSRGTFVSVIQDLESNTTYHYRAVSASEFGEDKTFTTLNNWTHITNVSELHSIGDEDSTGKYYVIDNNISGYLDPIDNFRGTLDGQGFTLTLNLGYSGGILPSTRWSGMFGRVYGATIKDIVFDNCTVSSEDCHDLSIFGNDIWNSTISGITFENCSIDTSASTIQISMMGDTNISCVSDIVVRNCSIIDNGLLPIDSIDTVNIRMIGDWYDYSSVFNALFENCSIVIGHRTKEASMMGALYSSSSYNCEVLSSCRIEGDADEMDGEGNVGMLLSGTFGMTGTERYRKELIISPSSDGALYNYPMKASVGQNEVVVESLLPLSSSSISNNLFDDMSWISPQGVAEDDIYNAYITSDAFDTGMYSYVLKTRVYGDSAGSIPSDSYLIPEDSTILGFEVEVNKKHANGDVTDSVVQLSKNGITREGNNKANLTTHWSDVFATTVYGGETDLWGSSWTPQEVNSPNFGVHLVVQAHSDNADAFINFVRVTVYYRAPLNCGGLVSPDFDDLRFTTSDGETLCSYWIESIVGTSPNRLATVWIRVPSIAASVNTTLYMYYYDDPLMEAQYETSILAGESVFSLFDDFEDGSLNSSKWGNILEGRVTESVGEGLTVLGISSSQPNTLNGVRSLGTFPGNYAFRSRVSFRSPTRPTPEFNTQVLFDGAQIGFTNKDVAYDNKYYTSLTGEKTNIEGDDIGSLKKYVILDIARVGSPLWVNPNPGLPNIDSTQRVIYYFDDNSLVHITNMGSTPFALGYAEISAQYTGSEINADWMLIRQCTLNEPMWISFGNESKPTSLSQLSYVFKCSASGSISVSGYPDGVNLGGFVGTSHDSVINNSFSRVDVSFTGASENIRVGGFSGYSSEILFGRKKPTSFINCYSEGDVRIAGGGAGTGFTDQGNVVSCYWRQDCGGISGVGTRASSSQMKTYNLYSGWDFGRTWGLNSGVNDGYPFFLRESELDIVAVYFQYAVFGTNWNDPGADIKTTMETVVSSGPFSASINGLISGVTYQFRAVANFVYTGCKFYGEELYLSPTNRAIVTENATGLNCTGATLKGLIMSPENTVISGVRFEYGKTIEYGEFADIEKGNCKPNYFCVQGEIESSPLTDLDSFTTYHYRAIGEIDGEKYVGEDVTFTTSSRSPGYSVFTTGSSDVSVVDSMATAILHGSVTEIPSSTSVDRFFQYVSDNVSDWRGATDTAHVPVSSVSSFEESMSLIPGRYKFRAALEINEGCRVYGDTEYLICPDVSDVNYYVAIKAKWIYNIYPDEAIVDNWTASSGLSSYECVNEDWKTPEDTTDVRSIGDGTITTFSFSDYPESIDNISKVVVTVRARRESNNDNLILFSPGNEGSGQELFEGSSVLLDYQNMEKVFTLNPVTGLSWTEEDITNMMWGIKKSGSESNVYVSQMYVTIYPGKINDKETLTNSTNWISLNMDSLISSGYLSSGLDSDFYYDKSLSYIPGNVKFYFTIPSLSAGQEASYRLKLATSPSYDHFNLVGTVSFLDNVSYEPGSSNWDLSWRGKVNTAISGYIARKTNSYELIVSDNSVQGKIWIDGVNDPLVLTDNSSFSGYYRYDLRRVSNILSLYRDGILRDSLSISGSVVDNGNSVEIGGEGTVIYSDLMTMIIGSSSVINPLPSSRISGSDIGDGYGRSGNIVVNKLFEMWTEGIVSGSPVNPWGIGDDEEGNLSDVVVNPGFIPNLFATGDGTNIPTSGDTTASDSTRVSLPFQETISNAAKALGVTTQWIWMMIMVTLSICVALLVFTWINSPWFAIMALCLCLFVFSFTGVLPAWIGLVTAIVGLASLFFGARSGF